MSERDLFPTDRESIRLASVRFGVDAEPRVIPAVRAPDGSWCIFGGVMASALIYMERARAEETAGNFDRSQYNGRRYAGGLTALGSDLREAEEELALINREQPTLDDGDWSLGQAVEVVDGKLCFYEDDFGIWKKIPPDSAVKIED